MEIEQAQEKLENMHFDDIAKSYCNKVNDLDKEKFKNKQLLDEIDMLKFQLKAADSVNENLSKQIEQYSLRFRAANGFID